MEMIKPMKSGLILLGLIVIALIMRGGVAQSSSGGCTSAILSMASCLNYVTGKAAMPSSGCCSSFDSVLKSQPRCLCTIVNGGGSSVGVQINQTAALHLPDACSIKTPPVSECNKVGNGAAMSPGGSPQASPADGASVSGGNIYLPQQSFPVIVVVCLIVISTFTTV